MTRTPPLRCSALKVRPMPGMRMISVLSVSASSGSRWGSATQRLPKTTLARHVGPVADSAVGRPADLEPAGNLQRQRRAHASNLLRALPQRTLACWPCSGHHSFGQLIILIGYLFVSAREALVLDQVTTWWQLVESRAAASPDRVMLRDDLGRTLTFGEFAQR